MIIIPGNAQHIGMRREQQDSLGFSNLKDEVFAAHGGVLAVLADGMGGLACGREASQTAVSVMIAQYSRKPPEERIAAALERAILEANSSVVELAALRGVAGDAGCTLSAAVVHGSDLYWVSVGDSRIYLFRQGRLTCLTTDHIYARVLDRAVQDGSITREDAQTHPEREALTSYLGMDELTEIDRNVEPFLVQPADRILLCSDGLYRGLPPEEIASFLAADPQDAAERLVERTLAAGFAGQDNVTVMIMGCETEQSVAGETETSPKSGWKTRLMKLVSR